MEKWHQCTITASNFKRVVSCSTGHKGLLKSMFDGVSLDHVKAVAHGQRHDADGVEAYKATKRSRNEDVAVHPCGLVLHTQYRFLGASPDGLVLDNSSSPRLGLLEVKCPQAAFKKSLSVTEACSDPSFCCELVDGTPSLRGNHAYYFQVQGQMAISGVKWCDFFVWIGLSSHLERIYATDSFGSKPFYQD